MSKMTLGLAAPAALALGAGLAFAAPAHADTQGYTDFLRSHGIPNPEGLVSQGMQECEALRSGKSETWLIGQLEHVMDAAQSDDIVVAAHRYLCPDA
jgi:Protein of unknown function (DUF732)